MFALEEVEQATRIKVLSFPEAPGKQADQAYINSPLGIRCLTLYFKDLKRVLERVKKASVTMLGETSVEISAGTWLLAVKDPDRNFPGIDRAAALKRAKARKAGWNSSATSR